MISTNNNLKGIHLFAPIIQLGFLEQNNALKEKYVPLILNNYRKDPTQSPDWNVHTSYNQEHLQENKLNWNDFIGEYTPYIETSINAYFKEATTWDIVGTPWYNVYGSGQSASQHSHSPDQFSFVHFLHLHGIHTEYLHISSGFGVTIASLYLIAYFIIFFLSISFYSYRR